MLIYIISGVGGYVVSGIFSPQTVSVGSNPAVYGLLGVMVVELFQAWQIIPNPMVQLFKLMSIIIISLLIGTLPYVDNWSHVGGFVFGVVSGIVFLPYITFGKWDARRKTLLLMLCIPLLLIMILMAWLTFYLIQNTSFCSW
jgi:membrane associated rhomboid family serine protease